MTFTRPPPTPLSFLITQPTLIIKSRLTLNHGSSRGSRKRAQELIPSGTQSFSSSISCCWSICLLPSSTIRRPVTVDTATVGRWTVCPGNERVGNKSVTYHPPWRVSVNPSLGDWSTETRIPTMPSPWGVTTCPRITDTRLHGVQYIRWVVDGGGGRSICFILESFGWRV